MPKKPKEMECVVLKDGWYFESQEDLTDTINTQ